MLIPYNNFPTDGLSEAILVYAKSPRLSVNPGSYNLLVKAALDFRRASLYRQSEELNLKAIEMGEQMGLGAGDDQTVLANLAIVYNKRAKYSESLEIYGQKLKQLSTSELMDKALCLSQLGVEQFREALKLVRKISSLPDINSHQKMRCSGILLRQGKLSAAQDLINSTKESDFDEWWVSEFKTVKTRIQFESLCDKVVRDKALDVDALKRLRKVVEKIMKLRESKMGLISCEAMYTLELAADIESELGHHKQATEMMTFVWKVRSYLQGEVHPLSLLSKTKGLCLEYRLGEISHRNAISGIRKCIHKLLTILNGSYNDHMAVMFACLAECYAVKKENREAVRNYKKAVDCQLAIAVPNHWKVKTWRRNIKDLK